MYTSCFDVEYRSDRDYRCVADCWEVIPAVVSGKRHAQGLEGKKTSSLPVEGEKCP
jgi:hypothetical protein